MIENKKKIISIALVIVLIIGFIIYMVINNQNDNEINLEELVANQNSEENEQVSKEIENNTQEETKKETTLVSSDRLKNANPLYWDSRKKTVISYRFSPFSFEDGAYLLLARLSDPMTREELFFANDSYDKQYRGYVLGTLQIKR